MTERGDVEDDSLRFLTREQCIVLVENINNKDVRVMSGPGTGASTLMLEVARRLSRMGDTLLVCKSEEERDKSRKVYTPDVTAVTVDQLSTLDLSSYTGIVGETNETETNSSSTHWRFTNIRKELKNARMRTTAMKREVDSIKGKIEVLENGECDRHMNFLFEEMDVLRMFSVKIKHIVNGRKKKTPRLSPFHDLSPPECDGRDLLANRMEPLIAEFKQRIYEQNDVLRAIREFLVDDKIFIDYFQTTLEHSIVEQSHSDSWNTTAAANDLMQELNYISWQMSRKGTEKNVMSPQIHREKRWSNTDSVDNVKDDTKAEEVEGISIQLQDMMQGTKDTDKPRNSQVGEPAKSKETLEDDSSEGRNSKSEEAQIRFADMAEQEKMLSTLEEERDLQNRHLHSLCCALPDEWHVKMHYLSFHQDVLSLCDIELPEAIKEIVRPGPFHIQTAKSEISSDGNRQRPLPRSQILKLRLFQQGLLKERDMFDIIENMMVDDENHLASLQALKGPVYSVGPSSQQILCPKLHLDAARANIDECHITTNGDLVNSPPLTRSDQERYRLKAFGGTCTSTTIPFFPPHPSLAPVYSTSRYWETLNKVRVLEGGLWSPVLEMGVSEVGQVDKEYWVSEQDNSWCVSVWSCDRHRGSVCTIVYRNGERGECQQNTMSDTPGTRATLRYGVVLLLDVERSRVAFIDLNRQIVLAKFDQKFNEDLHPVLSVCPNPDDYNISIKLVSGEDIDMTDTKKSLIHDALT